ncbi:MAG TPA: POTRA domain-containing protein [Kofleriaceae bacterium]|nr:POTRA domain-containing protein [Kofleriaceae bacterium]
MSSLDLSRLLAAALVAALAVAAAATTAAAQPTPTPAPAEPVPDDAPAADDGDDTGTAAAVALPPPAPPPAQWTEWDIAGTMVDPPERLRAILEPEMRARKALTATAEAELKAVLARLGYAAELSTRPAAGGGVRATIVVEPIVMVRWVDVHVDQWWLDVLLDDEIRRRLQLRPGAALPHDPARRKALIDADVARTTAFLRDEGFFDAQVDIGVDREGAYGGAVQVAVKLGPSYRLGRVRIVNQTEETALAASEQEILAAFDPGRGCVLGRCRFTRARFQAALDEVTALFQRRGYPSVRVESDFDARWSFDRRRRQIDVTVTIDQRQKLDIVFEGNDRALFPDDELQKQLTFADAGAADDYEIAASARAIERLYRSRGYFDVIVTSERVRLDTFDRVVYRIEPGAARTVRAVQIACIADDATRRCTLPAADLTAAIGTRAGGKAMTEQLDLDVAALEARYRGQGFQRARARVEVAPSPAGWRATAVGMAQVLADEHARDLHVRFVVDEGPRTVIEAIHVVFEGRAAGRGKAADERRVRRQLGIEPGDDHVPDQLAAAAEHLEEWYRGMGRPHARVTIAEPTPGRAPNRVVLTITVEERHEVRLGQVVVRGNFRTAEWVIRDELDLAPGALITADVLSGAPRRLRGTNLFNSVDLKLLGLGPNDTRDVVHGVVQVVERHDVFGELELEGGYSFENGGFVRARPILPNIGGVGIRLEAALTLGTQYQAAEGVLRLPRWLAHRAVGARFETELGAYARNQSTERFGDLFTAGASVAALRTWARPRTEDHGARLITAALRYDWRLRSRDEELVRPPGLAGNLTTNPIRTRAGTIGLTLTWDQRRDAQGELNPLVPDHGFRVEVGAAYAGGKWLLGTDTFVKLDALAQALVTIKRLQLRADLRYDHGIPLGGAVLLPEVERFFAGGDDTVRGFEEDRLATEIIEQPVPPLGQTTQIRVLPAGGNIRALASLDAQVTLWHLGSIPIASALFVDAGVITNTWTAFELEDIRPAAGSAVRLLLPIGAASVEYAVPLFPRTGDDPRGRLHFALALRY